MRILECRRRLRQNGVDPAEVTRPTWQLRALNYALSMMRTDQLTLRTYAVGRVRKLARDLVN